VETEPREVRSKNPLAKKRAAVWQERVRTSKKYHHLLEEFAHLASRWAIEQTLAAHCDTITLEDLKSLEPQIGKRNNPRLILALRGQIAKYIDEKAQAEGLRVITVNPRGTSSCCSRCGQTTKHYTCADPTTRKSGYVWAICPACQTSLDRDQAGAERLAGRGLAPAANFVVRVKTPALQALDPRTAPKKGPKAKLLRKELGQSEVSPLAELAAFSAIPEAGTLVTPPQLANQLSGHRPAAAKTQDPQSGLQSGSTLNLGLSTPVSSLPPPALPAWPGRAPRSLDGLRSAYLGLVKCSPLREITASPGIPS
jgi:IS605 OrfB family transposase